MITIDNAKTAIDVVARTINKIKSFTGHATTNSIADLAKLTRVEPLVVVSPDCINLDYMPQVSQSLLSLFCAYYLQGIDILCAVQNVEAIKILDKLNPNRDSTGFLMMHQESNLKYSLPLPGHKLHMEAVYDGGSDTHDARLSMHDVVNLSVGRLLDVRLSTRNENGVEAETSLKLQVRLLVSSIPESSIQAILSNGTLDSSMSERYHAWRSGKLEFIRDLILCQDMIDEKMRMAVKDTSGVGAEIHRRVAENRRFGVLTNNPSMATASNIFVMSEEVASGIEYKAGGKLTDYKTRQKVFENSYAMIMVVINRETGRMKFFVRNQPDYSNLSRKEIESAGKGKGPDVMEIFRSLQSASFSNF